jgi:competence protein ComEC
VKALLFILMGCGMLLLLFIVGPASSILRAISVGFVVLLGKAIGRPTHPLNSLAFAGLIWLVVNPLLIEDKSFLLSYAASFGILYMAPVMVAGVESRFPRGLRGAGPLMSGLWRGYFWVKRNIIHLGIITVASQWGVMPIIAWGFGRISLNGLLANLVAVPAGSIVLIIGALAGVAGFIHPFLSQILNMIANPLLLLMMAVAHIFAKADPFTIERVRMNFVVVIAYYLVSIMIIEGLRRGSELLALATRVSRGDLIDE